MHEKLKSIKESIKYSLATIYKSFKSFNVRIFTHIMRVLRPVMNI